MWEIYFRNRKQAIDGRSSQQIGPGNTHGHYLRRFRPANRHKLGLPLQWKEHTFAVAMCDIAREAGINLIKEHLSGTFKV